MILQIVIKIKLCPTNDDTNHLKYLWTLILCGVFNLCQFSGKLVLQCSNVYPRDEVERKDYYSCFHDYSADCIQ